MSAPTKFLGGATTVFLEILVESLLVRWPTLLVPIYAAHLRKPAPHESSFLWDLNSRLSKQTLLVEG